MHRRQRLAELAAQVRSGFTQRIQDLFFALGGDLLLSQRLAGLAVHGFQSQNIIGAQAGNRSGNIGFAPRP